MTKIALASHLAAVEYLEQRAIPVEVAKRFSIQPAGARNRETLAIPVRDRDGGIQFWQHRFLDHDAKGQPQTLPTDKEGKPQKYSQPKGKSKLSWWRWDPDADLLLMVEGHFKAASVHTWWPDDLPVSIIGCHGVDGWSGQIDPEWAKGRTIVFVHDKDASTNPNVAAAVRRLRKAGAEAEATIVTTVLPEELCDSNDAGIDDVLARVAPEHRGRFLAKLVGRATAVLDQSDKLRITAANEIRMQAVRWLWEETVEAGWDGQKYEAHWLPLGGLCLLGGREGIGKSTWGYRIASKVTAGMLPGALVGESRNVVVVATEDSWESVIVPRLTAADADLSRVFRVDAVQDELVSSLTLPRDMGELTRVCQMKDVAMILLDPLMGTIGMELDSHKDQHIRRALEPLSRLAHDLTLTIVGLLHVRKGQAGDLMDRLMGSRGFGAVARAVLACVPEPTPPLPSGDPEVQRRRSFLFGQAKNNLAEDVPYALRYHIEGAKVGHDEELGEPVYSSFIEVDEVVDGRISELLHEIETRKPDKPTKQDQAAAWLSEYLRGRSWVPGPEVKAAGEKAGYAERTLQRAAKQIGVVQQANPPGPNTWNLPSNP